VPKSTHLYEIPLKVVPTSNARTSFRREPPNGVRDTVGIVGSGYGNCAVVCGQCASKSRQLASGNCGAHAVQAASVASEMKSPLCKLVTVREIKEFLYQSAD